MKKNFPIHQLRENIKEKKDEYTILTYIIQIIENKFFCLLYCVAAFSIGLCACARQQVIIVDPTETQPTFDNDILNQYSEQNNINAKNNLCEIGIVNENVDSLQIKADIKNHEWEKNIDNAWGGKLFTFHYFRSNSKLFTKKGFQKEVAANGKERYLLADQPHPKISGIMLNVFVHGIKNKPGRLDFIYQSRKKNNFEKITRNNFILENRKPDKIQIGIKDPGDQSNCPIVHLFYFSDKFLIDLQGLNLIKDTLSSIAYIEIFYENVIILTKKLSGKETTIPFSTEIQPTNVRLVSRFGTIAATPDQHNKHLFKINLFPFIKTIFVKDAIGNPLDKANVCVSLNIHKKKSVPEDGILSLFGHLGRIFSKPEKSLINPVLIATQSDHEGKVYFLSWKYPFSKFTTDVLKQGYIPVENHTLSNNGEIILTEDKTRIHSLIFDFKQCMNENINVHKSKGHLNIYDNGVKVAKLKPDMSETLPFVSNPQYYFYHPSYFYNTIYNRFTDIFEVSPTQFNQKQKKGALDEQVLIIMDVTDDDPKGRAFIKAISALKKYLHKIGWDTFSKSKKQKFRIATAYHDHLNYLSSTNDINVDLLMVQADSSFTEQLKKAFSSFQTNNEYPKKVIYIISSKRATVVPDEYLVESFNTEILNNNRIAFNAIIIGDYGGIPLTQLAQRTYGKYSWCLTDDCVYSKLNQIIKYASPEEIEGTILCNGFTEQ